MSIVNGSLQNARATTAAIAASSAVPLDGQIVYNSQTGQYKIGDGVTTLSALTYYPTVSTDTFTITCAHGATVQFSAGATVYWSNWIFSASSLRSTAGQALTSIPYDATLVGATITTWNAASSVTQTPATVYFRYNGSDNTLSSAVLWSATAATPVQHGVTGLSVAVTANVGFEIKIVMPTPMATPPTSSAQCTVVLYFQV